jgi:RNA polymerase sigma-70 factor (ECF subfamily)
MAWATIPDVMARVRGDAAAGPRDDAPDHADPDVALMLRVQRGDERAFPELFRRFGPRVHQYVRRLLANPARAEEITQDVFVQILRVRDRYRPESRLTTWIFTIATNLCLNELRRPERRLRVDAHVRRDDGTTAEPVFPDTEGQGPEAAAASRELARALEAAVGALPAKQRAALLLSRVDGLSHRDVASALGTTEGAIKALLFRATQALKDRLRDFL